MSYERRIEYYDYTDPTNIEDEEKKQEIIQENEHEQEMARQRLLNGIIREYYNQEEGRTVFDFEEYNVCNVPPYYFNVTQVSSSTYKYEIEIIKDIGGNLHIFEPDYDGNNRLLYSILTVHRFSTGEEWDSLLVYIYHPYRAWFFCKNGYQYTRTSGFGTAKSGLSWNVKELQGNNQDYLVYSTPYISRDFYIEGLGTISEASNKIDYWNILYTLKLDNELYMRNAGSVLFTYPHDNFLWGGGMPVILFTID